LEHDPPGSQHVKTKTTYQEITGAGDHVVAAPIPTILPVPTYGYGETLKGKSVPAETLKSRPVLSVPPGTPSAEVVS
jgi:hypothetical protein